MTLITTLIISFFSFFASYLAGTDNESIPLAEKVYLHIDRKYYFPGDDIWFKAYVVNASTNELSQNTNTLHVELVSPDSKIIASRTIRIDLGTGNGEINLNELTPSGRYRIRAYTNYLRNYENPIFFSKEIVIINPSDGGKALSDTTRFIENKIEISFFPEGGSLVENISSSVAFKAVDQSGKASDVSGQIYSNAGELIATFQSTHLGMGKFNFKPVPGSVYYAVITDSYGKEYRAEIPKILNEGISIHTAVIQNNKLLVKVSTNERTLSSINNHEHFISISSRNLNTKNYIIRINSLVHNVIIPINDFPDGIIKVTLSGLEGLPYSEELVFIQKSNHPDLNITTDKPVYKPREQVRFNISLSGDSVVHDKTYLSLSVAEAGSCDKSSYPSSSIVSWFLLESDIRGPVEDPYSYFESSNLNRLRDMDLLLLTQGWRDFRWKYESTAQYLNEKGFSISGRVKRMLRNKPLAGTRVNVGLLTNNTSAFLSVNPDSAGRFSINGIDITGSAKVLVCTTDKENHFGGWLIIDSTQYKPADIEELSPQNQLFLTRRYSDLRKEAILKKIQRESYKLSDTISVGEVFVTSTRREPIDNVHISRSQYIKPDNELIITPDLENRSSLSSVVSGRLRGVEVSDLGEITVRGQTPLILLDGIPGRDISLIPPYMIDRIDVLYWSSLYGHQGANGIINVITKRGENSLAEKPEAYKAKITLKGYDFPRIFYSPKHNTNEPAYMSDTRSTIHWEPNVILENNGSASISYFNADKTTTIEVKAEGITSDGIPLTSRIRYDVKSQK